MPTEEKSKPAPVLDFQPVSAADWEALVFREMEGKHFPDAYAALGIGGMDHFPHPGDDDASAAAFPLWERGGWELGETVPVSSGNWDAANRRALEALEMGADSLRFVLPSSPAPLSGLPRLWQGIEPAVVPLYFSMEGDGRPLPAALGTALLQWSAVTGRPATARGGWTGWPAHSDTSDPDELAFIRDTLHPALPYFRTFSLERGGVASAETLVPTYARLLTQAVEMFHRHESCCPGFDRFSRRTTVTLSLGSDFFLEVAGLRAFRLLWRQLCRAYGLELAVMPLVDVYLAETGDTMAEADRLIRDTVRSAAAVLGGADRLTVLPTDLSAPEYGAVERRHARNVQHILRLEAFLDQVSDPLAGSLFIERLTGNIAQLAWDSFRQSQC
ncbi:MAG: hypothetical protein RLY31_2572 [Bacteroidota bacterium]